MIVHKELVDISFWQKCNIQELELTKMYWKQHTGIAFISVAHFFILSSCAVQSHYRTHPETVLTADDGRIRGLQDRTGDIILGGPFAIHAFVPELDNGQCTDAVRDQGIQSLDAMLYAIDAINSDHDGLRY